MDWNNVEYDKAQLNVQKKVNRQKRSNLNVFFNDNVITQLKTLINEYKDKAIAGYIKDDGTVVVTDT
jgi:hypothetical protein